MKYLCKNKIVKFFLLLNFFIVGFSYADNHDINDTLEQIKKDIQTLEKAVYSVSNDSSNFNNLSSNNLNDNSEDVLTRHLLKLSEIENQFQQLTNKFEEINFKLDKLSNRLSKVQSDNQLRFQDIETQLFSEEDREKLTKNFNKEKRFNFKFRIFFFLIF